MTFDEKQECWEEVRRKMKFRKSLDGQWVAVWAPLTLNNFYWLIEMYERYSE